MINDLITNISKVHTTELGRDRIVKNLKLNNEDVVDYLKNIILEKDSIIYRKGKNWYCENKYIRITVNANTYSIITAHII